tara:strand:+ start:509 stop:694 length:186 start_codon:yes stop_codon:yes gene_type:complete
MALDAVMTDNVRVENVIGGDVQVNIETVTCSNVVLADKHVITTGVFKEDLDFSVEFYVCSN